MEALCTAVQTNKSDTKPIIPGEELRGMLRGCPEFRNMVVQDEVMHCLCTYRGAKNRFLELYKTGLKTLY